VRTNRWMWWAGAVLLAAGCTTGTDDVVLDNPVDPGSEGSLPAPEAVVVTVGDNEARLGWSMPEGAPAPTRYAVFRRETAPDEGDVEKVGETATPSFADRQVRNGRIYGYRIAASTGGAFGKRSNEVNAAPALFSVVIENDVASTNRTAANLILTAPPTTDAMLISERPDFAGAAYRRYSTAASWAFSFGDGEKTVYARFRLGDGSESFPVSDAVVLDTRAVIRSTTFAGPDAVSPGAVVHFAVDAGEPDGAASIQVPGLFGDRPLFDDGTEGDPQPDDGVYEADVRIPAGSLVTRVAVTGRFTDGAGNTAAAVAAERTLTVEIAPDAVTLLDPGFPEPPQGASVTLRWTQSVAPDFAAYRVFRSSSSDVDAGDKLVGSAGTRTTVEISDGEPAEGSTYYYRVYVRSQSGLETGSNAVEAVVPNLRPPVAVTLSGPDGVSDTRVGLSWSESFDRDFARYVVRRAEAPAVDANSPVRASLDDVHATLWFDEELIENTRYYYRVYVEDDGGLATPSKEMVARTTNLPPPPVAMGTASAVIDTAATVSWSASNAHDFKRYLLYRDFGPSVGTFSTLVADIEEQETTSFRDTGLEPGTVYYYRVFVEDDGVDPGPLSTGSPSALQVTTPGGS